MIGFLMFCAICASVTCIVGLSIALAKTKDPLEKMVDDLRDYEMTPEEHEEQRRSFAYGNAHISNPHVTRKMVDDAAERFAARKKRDA